MGGACGKHGRREKSVQDFGGKARRKELLVRPRRRWEDGIRMNLEKSDLGSVEWIRLV
jgi:hypothetical protein